MTDELNASSVLTLEQVCDADVIQAARRILKKPVRELALIPEAAVKLVSLTRNEATRSKDLAKVIATEPVLAARVIRVVNSAAFFLPNKVSSINHAVSILGFSQVRQIAIDQLLYQRMIAGPGRQLFDRLFFWQHCLFVASMSRAIAVTLKHPDPDTVYTGGLLHDIGKIVFESYGRVSYSDFLQASERSDQLLLAAEAGFFGLDHCAMGGYFAVQWQLPSAVVAMIMHHHQLPNIHSDLSLWRLEAAIVSLSDYIAWIHGMGSCRLTGHPALPQEVFEVFDINRLDLDQLLKTVDQDMQKTQIFYDISFPELATLRATLVRSALLDPGQPVQQPVPAKPGHQAWSAILTLPHRSLEPKDFFPSTLAAVRQEFNLGRVMMLMIDPRKRGLKPGYWQPDELSGAEQRAFNLPMTSVTGSLLTGMRTRQGMRVNQDQPVDQPLLQRLRVDEFVIVPVLVNNRLIGLLYADDYPSNKALPVWLPEALAPIARELGVALGNARAFREVKSQAEHDPLTRLPNKRSVNVFMQRLFNGDDRKLARVAVGFIDIDYFKQFNDRCGHQAGDDALRLVADVLRSLTRPGDMIGRFGGEEFICVLLDTDREGALNYAGRMREKIERQGRIWSERFQGQKLTVSIGIAMYQPDFSDYLALIRAADEAMYQAKKSGRNRVKMYS